MKVEFYKHNLSAVDKDACAQVLDSLFLTTGSVVDEFEKKFASYTGNKFAIGTNSCTNSLFLSLKSLVIEEGDEVITSPMTFLATANAIERCGARTVLVDVNPKTGLLEPDAVANAITAKTRAIIPVHLYGQMCDVQGFNELAMDKGLSIIEDACHAIEGARGNIQPGNLSHAACFSFYATKNMTSGEGGMIVCNDQDTYDWLKMARLHGVNKTAATRYGKKFSHYDMEFLGYKCNMNNIQAAILMNQIDRLDEYRNRKLEIAKMYDQAFADDDRIELTEHVPDSKHAHHIYVIRVAEGTRDEFIFRLAEKGVGAAVNYRALSEITYYANKYGYKKGTFPNAENIGARCVTLPFYPKLSDEEVEHVIDSVLTSL